MRIPVFARGSNRAIDRPNQRKSESYGQEEVDAGRADWIDPNDHRQGILCRAFLYSGQTLVIAAPEASEKLSRPRRCPLAPLEVAFTRFDDPVKSLDVRKERAQFVLTARTIAFFGTSLDLVQQL
jgi:hypothetical protein